MKASRVRIKILEMPNRQSAGKAVISGLIHHHLKGRWIVCGDCNPRWKLDKYHQMNNTKRMMARRRRY